MFAKADRIEKTSAEVKTSKPLALHAAVVTALANGTLIDGQTDRQTDKRVDRQTDGRTDEQLVACQTAMFCKLDSVSRSSAVCNKWR